MGNINVGDGSKFRGRGFLHITGRNNYGLLSFGKTYKPDGSALESVETDFNDWMGTKSTGTATSVVVPNTDKVQVTGITEPNWWVRIEFPKVGNLLVERKDVQADAAGNYSVTSNKAHPPGEVKVTAVRYNFTEDAAQLSNNELLSAQVGSWYWQYAKKNDLNIDPTYGKAIMQINGGESPTSPQGISRRKHFELATLVTSLRDTNGKTYGNTYGNMRLILGGMGIKAFTATDYNTKFGITLQKRNAVPIIKAPGNLQAADAPLTLSAAEGQRLIQDLQNDFDLNIGDVDMLYMNMPDAAPVQIAAVATNVTVAKAMRTDGVCAITSAGALDLGYDAEMWEFLPKERVRNNFPNSCR